MEEIKIKDGFIQYELFYDGDELLVELRRIFVPEESRRKGIGTQLLNELVKAANGKKIVTFSSTDPEREVFGKFLVAEGFVKTNRANSTGDMWELTKKVPIKEKEEKIEKVKITKKRGRPKK